MNKSPNKSYRNFLKVYKENDERWKYFFIGIILAFISIVVFVNIIQYYFKNKGKLYMDIWAINYAKSIESDSLSNFFKTITNIGNPASVIVITIIIVIALYFKKMKNESIFFGLNILGVWLFNEALKASFRRDRPSLKLIKATGYSLPSGHAMVFLAFSILASYLILLYLNNRLTAYLITVCLVLLAIIIGASRVYLRVHYLSDVLAGWSAALFWSGINIAIHRFSYYRRKIKRL
ncbi:phosphatase PAP2 family protein [Clostridium lundense]|uniref:phosphatase PAP2 family protein n=1 Tax=Clostridium lundense TaxID=319475 RepID=UPI000484E2F5|nr:phosphatase PAP2 family protein [Clostridium lundense]